MPIEWSEAMAQVLQCPIHHLFDLLLSVGKCVVK